MSYPQAWQVFGTQRWNLAENGATHAGHLILPAAKAQEARHQKMAKTINKKTSALQTQSRTEKRLGNIQRNTSAARAIASNGPSELTSSRFVRTWRAWAIGCGKESEFCIATANGETRRPIGAIQLPDSGDGHRRLESFALKLPPSY
jgi:hypothetical protein